MVLAGSKVVVDVAVEKTDVTAEVLVKVVVVIGDAMCGTVVLVVVRVMVDCFFTVLIFRPRLLPWV